MDSSAYTLTGETKSLEVPVGTEVITKLGAPKRHGYKLFVFMHRRPSPLYANVTRRLSKAFLFVKAMTSGGPNGASEVALSYMYGQKDAGLYGYSMAIGVVVFLFSFLLSALVNKVTKREPLEF